MMRPPASRLAIALLPAALVLATAARLDAQTTTGDPWVTAPAEAAPPASSDTAGAWEQTRETSQKVWGTAADKAAELWESTDESRESLARDATRFGEDFLRDWDRVTRKIRKLTE